MSSRTPAQRRGDVIVLANAIGTAAFVITALTAAIVFSTAAQWVGAITAMSLFAIGVFTFLWAFYNAAQRSRVEQLSVMQLFFLVGPPTPPRIRRSMNLLLLIQVVAGLGTALARPNGPDGSPGSSLAVGILVPMFGLGLNGLWAAFHGDFPALDRSEPSEPERDDREPDDAAGGESAADDLDEPGGDHPDASEDHQQNHHEGSADRAAVDDGDGGARSTASIDQNGPHG
ncbi:MAG: hypothetical protein AAGA42_10865 [Actinomycetota bacterium]